MNASVKGPLIMIALALGLPVAGLVGYVVAFVTVPPSFSAEARQEPSGDPRIYIEPNFVVRSIYKVEVTGATGLLAERPQPQAGHQTIVVPGPLRPGTAVTVTCDLQYDRIVPSITRTSRVVTLP